MQFRRNQNRMGRVTLELAYQVRIECDEKKWKISKTSKLLKLIKSEKSGITYTFSEKPRPRVPLYGDTLLQYGKLHILFIL